jgi:DNA-binding HxlR family transcriptional regulator
MRHDTLAHQNCSIGWAASILGERWTLAILREAFNRTRRFEDYQRNLGIARNMLADRLRSLVEEGVLERRPYQERPARYEYRLTQKGLDLYPILVSLMQWGDKYADLPEGPPAVLVHKTCGHVTSPQYVCSHCGEAINPREVRPAPASGGRAVDRLEPLLSQ